MTPYRRCDALSPGRRVGPTCPSGGKKRSDSPTVARGGSAMIVAIVCLLLVTAISISLVKYAVAAHQRSERLGWQLQSAWLAESVLGRTAAKLRKSDGVSESSWMTEPLGPAQEIGRVQVTIRKDADDARALTVTVVADFPDDPTDRVRTTRTIRLTRPEPTPATTP